jgi:hypothetical protein
MSFTHTIAIVYTTDSGQVSSTSAPQVNNYEANFEGTITGSATPNVEVDWACAFANLKSLLIVSDKACSIFTNAASTGSPDDTLALAAGVPLVWAPTGFGANPFTANVTKIYITVTGTASATLKIRALLDQTP